MKALGAVVLLGLGLLGAAVAWPHDGGVPRSVPLSASPAPTPLLGVLSNPSRLSRLDPLTLRPRGRTLPLRGFFGRSFSADGSLLAAGDTRGAIRIVDTRRLRIVRRLDTRAPGMVRATRWTSNGVLLALVGRCCAGDTMLVVLDPRTGRVRSRRGLGGQLQAVKPGAGGLVVVLSPLVGLGPSRLAVVDALGQVRSAALPRTRSGYAEVDHSRPAVQRFAVPALATDTATGRAFVLGAGEPVAEVDLGTLAVRYHALSRPVSVLGRVRDWLEPAALAKGLTAGPYREARWLGDGLLAVWGTDTDGAVDAEERAGIVDRAAGLDVVDTRDWSAHTLHEGASRVEVADGLLVASAFQWDSRPPAHASGIGLVAYGADGRERFHALGNAPLTWLEVVGRRAFVERYPPRRGYTVVDLDTGAVVTEVARQMPYLLR